MCYTEDDSFGKEWMDGHYVEDDDDIGGIWYDGYHAVDASDYEEAEMEYWNTH